MIPKHQKLIQDLIEKTGTGSLKWEETDAEDQYALKLKNGAIIFDRLEERDPFSGAKIYSYVFTIVNNEGKEIDSIVLVRHDALYFDTQVLYSKIHRLVNRVDEQIDEILSELESR